MSTTRTVLSDVSNITLSSSTPTKNKNKSAKMLIPKLSKRRQSVSGVTSTDTVSSASSDLMSAKISDLWIELERIVNLHIPDQSHSTRALSIIDTLRSSAHTPKDMTSVLPSGNDVNKIESEECGKSSCIEVGVYVPEVVDKGKLMTTEKEKNSGDARCKCDDQQQQASVAPVNFENQKQQVCESIMREEKVIKETDSYQAQHEHESWKEMEVFDVQNKMQPKAHQSEENIASEDKIKIEDYPLSNESNEGENVVKINQGCLLESKKKAEDVAKELDTAQQEAEKKERKKAIRREKARKKREQEKAAKELTNICQSEGKQVIEVIDKHSPGIVGNEYLSEDEETVGACFIHWDSNNASAAATGAATNDKNEDNKRLYVEIENSAQGNTTSRKSPRKEEKVPSEKHHTSPDLAMFDSLLLSTPSESVGPTMNIKEDSPKNNLNDARDMDNDDEDEFGFSAGIIHMSILPTPKDEPSIYPATFTKEPSDIVRNDHDTSLMIGFENEDENGNMSPRAKRRHRRASLSTDPATHERSRSRGKKKKRTDHTTTEREAFFEEEGSESTTGMRQVSPINTKCSVHRNWKEPLRCECVDSKVVQIVLEQNNQQLVLDAKNIIAGVTHESCENFTKMMKESLDSYILSVQEKSADDRHLSKMLAEARALFSGHPVSLLLLQSAFILVNSFASNFFKPKVIEYFNPLQLALLNMITRQFPILENLGTQVSNPDGICKTPEKRSKKLRFQESVGSCVSPPNDREPGSCKKFELCAQMLESVIVAIDELALNAKRDIDLSALLASLTSSLAVLSTNTALLHSLIVKMVPRFEKELTAVDDIKRLADVLCTEFALRRFDRSLSRTNAITPSSDEFDELSIPNTVVQTQKSLPNSQFRSILRHRTSWVLTSVVR